MGQQRKGEEAAAGLSGKQAHFSLEQEQGASQKSACPGMPSQPWFSAGSSSFLAGQKQFWGVGLWLLAK